MTAKLPGYHLGEKIYEGVKTVIYRALKEPEGTRAIVKTLKAEYPSVAEITQLRHEYKIQSQLNLGGTVKAIALERYQNGLALVLEEFPAESLAAFIASIKKLDELQFLQIAIQLAAVLADLRDRQIIHKDIKPQNILINPASGEVKLIDFSIASRLEVETQIEENPNLLEGTLAYMSPEQTGRMNRSLDYRTDFYSLGVTFYEILTGALPFTSTDPIELVHSHIAKTPLSPHRVNPEIPKALSDIVMKLMAKTAEERYQSSLGLKADLEDCLLQWQARGKIENFIPGDRDKYGHFLIPEKLYGREAEVRLLLDAFVRVASVKENSLESAKENTAGAGKLGSGNLGSGTSEMMLVSGYSGIGKTRVVREVHKPIVAARGYFIAGKFDQFKRNIPYAALIEAFSNLIRQMLAESASKISSWKQKLLAALGDNGQVIVDVIPEVELIIGQQPEVPELGASETQNRFNRVFKSFISVFTQPSHPLVIFLDDLQWADSASLKLLELLMADAESRYLLFLGAYRDNEVSPSHATIQTIEKIKQAGTTVNQILLEPLALSNVRELVADTCRESAMGIRVNELAELLANKTGGNPFFLTQLLKTLHAEKLLSFDFAEGCWLWDIDRIQAVGIVDYNVVELVARNIQKLPLQTQQILKLAACIGNRFNLDVLAIVCEKSAMDSADDLWEALQAGLILPLSNEYKIPLAFQELESRGDWRFDDSRVGYKFLHDRVQQAAYSLIPPARKKATHLKVGKLLLHKTQDSALEENVFDIVNQLNVGVESRAEEPSAGKSLAEDARSELREAIAPHRLAALNLMAGKKAKAATAYQAATEYFNVGLRLLDANSWDSRYDLTLSLYVEAAEAEYLNSNIEQFNVWAAIALQKAKTLLEKIKLYELQIQSFIVQSKMQEAIERGQQILDVLGFSLEKKPPNLPSIEELATLPEMTDTYKLAALQIAYAFSSAAFSSNDLELSARIIFTNLNLSIQYGNSPLGALSYIDYGLFLCSSMQDIDWGYRLGQLGSSLLDKFDAKKLKSIASHVFNSCIRHGRDHLRKSLVPLQEGFQTGLETGELIYSGYGILAYCGHLFSLGENLEFVKTEQVHYLKALQKSQLEYHVSFAQIGLQLTCNLLDEEQERAVLVGDAFDKRAMTPVFQKYKIALSLLFVYVSKLTLLYLFKKPEEAIAAAREAEKMESVAASMFAIITKNLYYSLALLARYPHVETSEQQQYLSQVESNQEKMQHWASHAPSNFKHKYELVEAEKAGVLGETLKAMEYYDRAIAFARENGYVQDEALGNELAAEFYLSLGRQQVAKTYLTEAYYGYIRWGALAKVRDLEERYTELIIRTKGVETLDIHATLTTATNAAADGRVLDLATVLKASQALSGEIVLKDLLDRTIRIAMENAGADKCCLLTKPELLSSRLSLGEEGEWAIAAYGEIAEIAEIAENLRAAFPTQTVDNYSKFPLSIINYVARTQEPLVLNDAIASEAFARDPYIRAKQTKSILCSPIIHQGKLTGVLYLENNLSAGAFTPARVTVLQLLTSQISISMENARLYGDLQQYSQQLELKNAALQTSEVREREKAEQLAQSLQELQQTQAQLVQAEKISSLGQLVAGVAHEVNNPVGFISGNLHYAEEYVEDLLALVAIYQQHLPNPPAEIAEKIEAMELDYLREDLPQLLSSMKLGTERICEIMQSLRNFSRADKKEKQLADIHQGIDSTLMILSNRLKAKSDRSEIKVVKEYGDLPEFKCYPGQLNQVFMNILANAIDVLEGHGVSSSEPGQEPFYIPSLSPTIHIRTEIVDFQFVLIRIADNGPGIPEAEQQQLFKAFFTTKPEGKGTGLGLSISYQIVTDKHGGNLHCVSAPERGTEFIIEIPLE